MKTTLIYYLTIITLIYYLIINTVLFIFMGVDKLKAKLHKRRIPEASLFALAFTGGALGGFCGMFVFRHKIRKPKFYIIFLISLILHIAFLYLIYSCKF